jgi:fumarate hydratase class II
MGTSLLESIRLLSNSCVVLASKTIDGLEANKDRSAALAGMSPSIVTPLNRIIGYEAAAKVAKHSVKAGITVRDAVIELGYVERGEISITQLDKALDLKSMTHPGVAK